MLRPAAPCDRRELPLELVELIVAYVSDDRRTLRAASLVCGIWRTAAFPYLVSDALIAEEADFDRIQKLSWRFPRLTTYHLQAVTLRPGRRPSTTLTFSLAWRSFGKLLEDRPWELTKDASNLPLMPKVTSLRWLIANEIHHWIIVNPIIYTYLSKFPSLQRLTIQAKFEDIHELKLFLALCGGQLRSINLQGIYFRRERPLQLMDGAHRCNFTLLERLTLGRLSATESQYDLIADLFILVFKSGTNLRTLRLRYDWTISPQVLERLLERVGPTLESFSMEPIGTVDLPVWLHPSLPFARFSESLKTLSFGMPHLDPSSATFVASPPVELVEFLRYMRSLPHIPSVSVLNLYFRITDPWNVTELWGEHDANTRAEWGKSIARFMMQFPSLQTLNLALKLKSKFKEKEKREFMDIVEAAITPMPGLIIHLQMMEDES